MEDPRTQLVEKLNSANNILVTVSRNPSVDQLAALLGLTLYLNKLGKHAAAVFSGEVPSTLEFLQPEQTIEKTTDSLRDFIIALDKNKADKLRYKVEDNVVRIFITPYRTSISQDDFNFSQGDFNVDLVVALGVKEQQDIDQAITAHGRILHDATVASINLEAGNLGSINWNDPTSSSLSELVAGIVHTVNASLLDEQIATALLTGIVAATNRFSNEKTSSQTMTLSAALMSAGANQQLVASKLAGHNEPANNATGAEPAKQDEKVSAEKQPDKTDKTEKDNSTLAIDHKEKQSDENAKDKQEKPKSKSRGSKASSRKKIAAAKQSDEDKVKPKDEADKSQTASRMITEPPTMGGTLTANTKPEPLDPVTDPLSLGSTKPNVPMLDHNVNEALSLMNSDTDSSQPTPPLSTLPEPVKPASDFLPPAAPTLPPEPAQTDFTPPPPAWTPPPPTTNVSPPTPAEPSQTPVDFQNKPVEDLSAAREEVSQALNDANAPEPVMPEPIAALNAQPVDLASTQTASPAPQPPLSNPMPPVTSNSALNTPPVGSNTPPPVPPPIPFQFGQPPKQ